MKTKQKHLFLVILSVVFAVFLFCGIGTQIVFADEQPKTLENLTTFQMESGASIRKNNPTGLRFRSYLSPSDYKSLMANVGEGKEYSSASFGMLIAPQDYVKQYGELTEANVFGENAVYSLGEGESVKPQIINVYSDEMNLDERKDQYFFCGIITNVKPTNYNREFVGMGYIKATKQNGTVVYKMSNRTSDPRSVISVAQKAIDAGEEDKVLTEFTKYASLGGIVSGVQNGDKAPEKAVDFKTGEISVTATADHLYLNLNKNVITANGAGFDYVRLYLKSTTPLGTAFRILPRAKGSNDVDWTSYMFTLGSNGISKDNNTVYEYVDIPLNDPSVHDFSSYDLRLYAAEKGQNITVAKIEYVSMAQDLLKAENWFADDAITKNKDGSITASGWAFGISSEYIKKAVEAGYTHLRFDYVTENKSDTTKQGVYMEGQGTAYQKCYQGTGSARFDLTSLKKADGTYAKIGMQGRDSAAWGEEKDISLTVTNPTLFKSAETASWEKSAKNLYCAVEEDGFIVIDTIFCGNDQYVLSTAEWWEKYANNAPAGNVNQRTVILSGKYLYAGANTQGAAWGKASVKASVVGLSANTGIVTTYINDLVYEAGSKFYYGLEKEGVYALKVSEFVSRRNEWAGFAYTYVNENTFTVTMNNEFQLINVNTQDYIAQGYTKVVITASEYTGGQMWVGNGNWGVPGCMQGLDSGKSKTLDLSLFTADNPYLFIHCADKQVTVTLTVSFF